jgi:glycine/D-amino acid oxidase-like deaminating enzyme
MARRLVLGGGIFGQTAAFHAQSRPALVVTVVLSIMLRAKSRHEELWLRELFSDYASHEQCARRFIARIYRDSSSYRLHSTFWQKAAS